MHFAQGCLQEAFRHWGLNLVHFQWDPDIPFIIILPFVLLKGAMDVEQCGGAGDTTRAAALMLVSYLASPPSCAC